MDCSRILVVNSIEQIQNNLEHQRTEVSRLVALLNTIVLCVSVFVLLRCVVISAVMAQMLRTRLLKIANYTTDVEPD